MRCRGRSDHQPEDEQCADGLNRLRDGDPDEGEKEQAHNTHRDPSRGGDVTVH